MTAPPVGMTNKDHRAVDRGDVCGDPRRRRRRDCAAGFGGATTECPAVCSSRITPPKPDASAKGAVNQDDGGVQVMSSHTQHGSAFGSDPSPIQVSDRPNAADEGWTDER